MVEGQYFNIKFKSKGQGDSWYLDSIADAVVNRMDEVCEDIDRLKGSVLMVHATENSH